MVKTYDSYLQCTQCRIKPSGNLLSAFNKGKKNEKKKNETKYTYQNQKEETTIPYERQNILDSVSESIEKEVTENVKKKK